jgi:hypothetical protein
MLLLLPEEIWRPETSSLLKFLYMGVHKKNSTAEKYLQFLNPRKQYAVIKSGHEVQSNCNSLLQRTKSSSKTDRL